MLGLPESTYSNVDSQYILDRTHPYAQDLLSFWGVFPGSEGGNFLRDLCYRHDGVITAPAAATGFRPTIIPGAYAELSLDGATSKTYVNCGEGGGDYDLNLTEFTIIADVLCKTVTSTHGLVSKGNIDSFTNASFHLYIFRSGGSDFLGSYVMSGGGIANTISTPINTITTSPATLGWSWKASSSLGEANRHYSNGRALNTNSATTAASIDNTTFDLLIGSAEGNAAVKDKYPLNAHIANIAIYKRAYNENTMLDIYRHRIQGYPGMIRRVGIPPDVAGTPPPTLSKPQYFFAMR